MSVEIRELKINVKMGSGDEHREFFDVERLKSEILEECARMIEDVAERKGER